MTASLIAGAALLIAIVALAHSRRTARQLAQITEMYWQLKFDHGELKAKVDPPSPAPPQPNVTFVPLIRPPSPTAAARQDPREAGSAQDK
jgi:hypothetical protein